MSVAEVLGSGRWLTALALYLPVSAALLWAAHRLADEAAEVAVPGWLAEHVALPLARVVAMLVLLLGAYPVIFGLEQAPGLRELLGAVEGRPMALVNAAFLVAVLLPLIPVLGGLQALVLPLQGITAAALLFHWLAGPSASLWPPAGVAGAILAWALVTHVLGTLALERLGRGADRLLGTRGLDLLAHDSLMLVAQVPAILVYSLSLGAQLRTAA